MPFLVGAAPAAGIVAGVAAGAATKKALKESGAPEPVAIIGSAIAAGAAHTGAAAAVAPSTDWIGGSACAVTGGMHMLGSLVTQTAVAIGKKVIEEW